MNDGRLVMSLVMLAIFGVMVGVATQYPPQARFMPLVVGLPGIALCLVQVVLEIAARRRAAPGASADGPGAEARRREFVLWGSFLGLVASLILFGFYVTIPLFLVAFLRGFAKESWRFSLALGAGGSMLLALVFHVGLGVVLHQGFLLEPVLDHFFGS
jgi:hypothetical protein